MNTIKQVISGTYENHVLPFLWQKGESRDIIEDYLIQIKNSDINEICLESRPHPDFCGENWWQDLSFIIAKCKELDLKLWLLDDSHFPTGYANGWIKDKYPQHKKTVLTHRVFDVVGPQKQCTIYLNNMFDPTETFYGAVAMQGNNIFAINNQMKGDRLTFDVKDGLWQICVIFTSRQCGFHDDYINMVDKQSCEVLIKAVYEPHYEHFKEEFGKTILGFFSDEPGFMNEKGINADSLIGKDMVLPWSKETEARLKKVLGSEYMEALPALWMEGKDQASIRHAYMDIVTDLYKECFDEQLGKWCRDHSVMHIGHVIEDKDSHARLGVGSGHYFRALAGQDMAGIDIVINQLVPGMDEGYHSYGRGKWDMEFFNYALPKLGSSLAHVDPLKKGRCMAEVFGAFGWHEGLKEMKWIADHFLVRGVNYFVPHAFSQAEFPDEDCPPHFYAHGHNPQFRYFGSLMRYMNQMGTLLHGGTTHPVAAILYHADAEWCGDFMSIQKVAKVLTRSQIDFDFVPADVFAKPQRYHTIFDEKGLVINGITYPCFILPYCEYIGKDVAEFLQKAKEFGYPVYVLEQLPSHLYDGESMPDLSHVKVLALQDLVKDMFSQGLYDLKTEQECPWLRSYHYTKTNEDYYMLVNEHPKKRIDTIISGMHGTLIDVMQEKEYPFHEHLVMEPYEAFVLVPNDSVKTDTVQLEEMELSGPWQISFADAKSYPTFDQASISDTLPDIQGLYPHRCGTFRYQTTWIGKNAGRYELVIEEAYETVEVFVDGISKGCQLCPPYRFDLGSLSASNHRILIEVTNTLDKEIHDMFSLTEVSEPSGILGKVMIRKEV